IRSIPTLILFRGAREVDRLSGALSAVELKRWLLAR
ncbi:MAG TPA: thioredoxin family protein, partial [Casimicrobiaceae bacterium]|nr:thioredoxin family protein [Casimicrobiaceae bacterium]